MLKVLANLRVTFTANQIIFGRSYRIQLSQFCLDTDARFVVITVHAITKRCSDWLLRRIYPIQTPVTLL